MSEKRTVYVFSEKYITDPNINVVNLTNVCLLALLGFIGTFSLLALLLVNNYPYPQPKSPMVQVGHLWNLLFGYFIKAFQWEGFKFNLHLLRQANQDGFGTMLLVRWFGCLVGAIVATVYIIIKSMVPRNGISHVNGKRLLEGKEAYNELKVEFNTKKKKGSGVVFLTPRLTDYIPVTQDPKTGKHQYTSIKDLKPGSYIELPEHMRRTHTMATGKSGSGKTQLLLYNIVFPNYVRIKDGENIKMMICDTPKSDYSNVFSNERIIKIAPHEKGSVIWNISNDIYSFDVAKEYWKGRIPVSEKDPIWGNSAIEIASGGTALLQDWCPKSWNFGMLFNILSKDNQFLKDNLPAVAPSTSKMMESAEQTLASMMSNVGTYSTDLLALSRIWEGYDLKKSVFQATTKALTFPKFLDFIVSEMSVENKNKIFTLQERTEYKEKLNGGSEYDDFANTQHLFKAVCVYLNKAMPNGWKWQDFAKLVSKPLNEQKEVIQNGLDRDQRKVLIDIETAPHYWTYLCSHIVFYAKEWDKIEARPKFSVSEWLMDENPKRKVLILKPSSKTPELTTGLIKGILYLSNNVILDDEFGDDPNRQFYVLIDELASYGKIDYFIKRALEMYRSRGVSIALSFQDLAQMDEIYDRNLVPFLTGNTANLFFTGHNAGDSSERVSKLVGTRKVRKINKSISNGNVNEGWQEVEEALMIPSDVSTKLGAQLDSPVKHIKYLYVGANLPNNYILEVPIVSYPAKSTPVAMSTDNYRKPEIPSIEQVWEKKPNDWFIKDEVEQATE